MTKNTLTKLIEKQHARIESDTRDYIGASSIGHDCLRNIWYQFKGIKAEEVPTKIRRTWAIGRHLEGLIVEWLIDCDLKVFYSMEYVSSKDMPYFQGHVDAIWEKKNKPFAIIEIKTAKDSSFNIFQKKGVKEWNPQYYAQVQSYMGMSEIHKTYILVLNKDTSELSDELVKFDAEVYEQLREKAKMIYNAKSPPPRIHHSPIWYQCKQCQFNKTCHA